MAKKVNKKDPRTFMYLGGGLKEKITLYAQTDVRFESVSECCRHLILLGLEADKAAREKMERIIV